GPLLARSYRQLAVGCRDSGQAEDVRLAAHVGPQRFRHFDRAVAALVVLDYRDERAADRQAGPVQRMHEFGLALRVAKARVHPSRLERLAIRARRDLAIHALAGKPDLEVVAL